MTAEEIYRTVLQKIAEEGHTEARLALQLGEAASATSGLQMYKKLAAHLTQARSDMQAALKVNAKAWSHITDRHLNQAIQDVTLAEGMLLAHVDRLEVLR